MKYRLTKNKNKKIKAWGILKPDGELLGISFKRKEVVGHKRMLETFLCKGYQTVEVGITYQIPQKPSKKR